MINLRFHIVSLIAVFLALAIGIAVGTAVVDQGLVRQLERNLNRLERDLRGRDRQIASIRSELADWKKLGEESEARLVRGRLSDQPVIVVVPQGTSRDSVEVLVDELRAAGATISGQLWLNRKVGLDAPADLVAVRRALSAASRRPETLRYLLRARLRDVLLGVDGASIEGLRKLEFVSVRGATASTSRPAADGSTTVSPGGAASAGTVTTVGNRDGTGAPGNPFPAGAKVLVIAGPASPTALSSDPLIDLIRSVSRDSANTIVAADVTAPAEQPSAVVTLPTVLDVPAPETASAADLDAAGAPALARRIRADGELRRQISSVDRADSVPGRVATVLALEDLRIGRRGHYGTDKSAGRLVPAA